MLEFEFNSRVETTVLVEFFARCGWQEEEADTKVEWALANSDDWVLCKLDGELIGFGRSCRLGPLDRVVFDLLVDSRYHGRGLRAEIVRLLSLGAGGLEHVSVYSEGDTLPPAVPGVDGDVWTTNDPPWAPPGVYLGKRRAEGGDVS